MNNSPVYYITREQFELFLHYKRMFEANADDIQGLCSSEKDDIVYGFELGRIHHHLRDCFCGMLELQTQIENQKMQNDTNIN